LAASINSRHNERYKDWYAVSRLSRGRKTGRIFLEGLRLCQTALAAGVKVEAALLAQSTAARFIAVIPDQIPTWHLADQLFASLADTKNPQGIALVCRAPDLANLPPGPQPKGLYLLADQLADPANLGTMTRTAAAFAFTAVLMTEGTVWPFNQKAIRASMGAVFLLPIYSFPDLAAAVAWLETGRLPVFVADAGGELAAAQLPAGGGALLIGNEAHGISDQARQLATATVHIPMPGRTESLNAAAAMAVLAYEMMQRRDL
jgi:TrmH family RNA methyltransferase